MFKRVDKFLVIVTNNIMAMEVISQWIYRMMCGSPYFIEIEVFPKMTLYRIYIDIDSRLDKKLEKSMTEELQARHIELMKEL